MRKLTIGKDASNDIVLNSQFISREHARLVETISGQVMVIDMKSSNGTYVNGQRITEALLQSGDKMKCADVMIDWQSYFPVNSQISTKTPSAEFQVNTEQQSSSVPNNQPQRNIQQNVIVIGKQKSVGVAFLLAFLFGPLGLLYASVTGGIVMFLIGIPVGIMTVGIGLIFIWPICIIWAIVAANNANAQARNNALIQNQYYK